MAVVYVVKVVNVVGYGMVFSHRWGEIKINYTISIILSVLTGRKECRGTLFPASVTQEIRGHNQWVAALFPGLPVAILKPFCQGTLFLASYYWEDNSAEVATLFLAC